jgi:hypothetical protein
VEVQVLPEVRYRVVVLPGLRASRCYNGVVLVKLDIQITAREMGEFLKWWATVHRDSIGSNIAFFSLPRFFYSSKNIDYITRSAHAQTKYGVHFGIRQVVLRGRAQMEATPLHLSYLRSLAVAACSLCAGRGVKSFVRKGRHGTVPFFRSKCRN